MFNFVGVKELVIDVMIDEIVGVCSCEVFVDVVCVFDCVFILGVYVVLFYYVFDNWMVYWKDVVFL